MPFSVPASAKPFTLHVSDKDLAEFKQLLQLSKISPATWESLQEDRRFGITHKWITESRDYWLNKYDWRAKEKHINSLPNYKMEIEGVDVHFIGLLSDKIDAAPIVLMHGWPGSFVEFLPIVELVQSKYKPADQPYHVIIASLPGYPLSEGLPTDKDWKTEDSARVIDTLMVNLGFEKYIAHGGDVGSFVAGLISRNYDWCIGSHGKLTSSYNPILDID
jgi:pimeloyl-ACP methyl ester carboxylesterase